MAILVPSIILVSATAACTSYDGGAPKTSSAAGSNDRTGASSVMSASATANVSDEPSTPAVPSGAAFASSTTTAGVTRGDDGIRAGTTSGASAAGEVTQSSARAVAKASTTSTKPSVARPQQFRMLNSTPFDRCFQVPPSSTDVTLTVAHLTLTTVCGSGYPAEATLVVDGPDNAQYVVHLNAEGNWPIFLDFTYPLADYEFVVDDNDPSLRTTGTIHLIPAQSVTSYLPVTTVVAGGATLNLQISGPSAQAVTRVQIYGPQADSGAFPWVSDLMGRHTDLHGEATLQWAPPTRASAGHYVALVTDTLFRSPEPDFVTCDPLSGHCSVSSFSITR